MAGSPVQEVASRSTGDPASPRRHDKVVERLREQAIVDRGLCILFSELALGEKLGDGAANKLAGAQLALIGDFHDGVSLYEPDARAGLEPDASAKSGCNRPPRLDQGGTMKAR